jgi:hypothetical protein
MWAADGQFVAVRNEICDRSLDPLVVLCVELESGEANLDHGGDPFGYRSEWLTS